MRKSRVTREVCHRRREPIAEPHLVCAGPRTPTKILVVDPAGQASRGLLPGSWRETARRTGIAWYRLMNRSIHELLENRALHEFLGDAERVHLLTAGRCAVSVLALAAVHAPRVRSLLLANPLPSTSLRFDAEDEFENQWQPLWSLLKRSGIHIDLLRPPYRRPSTGIAPLGLPEIVSRVNTRLAMADERS